MDDDREKSRKRSTEELMASNAENVTLELEDESSYELLVQDFNVIGEAKAEQFTVLTSQIRSLKSMLTEELFEKLANAAFENEATSAAVFRVISALNADAFADFITWFGDKLKEQVNPDISPEKFASACKNLLPIYTDCRDAIIALQKSVAIVNYTGNSLKRIHFVCDSRPVFNVEHTEILGFATLTHFLMGYEEQDDNHWQNC